MAMNKAAKAEKAEAKLHGIINPDENIDPEYEENVQGE